MNSFSHWTRHPRAGMACRNSSDTSLKILAQQPGTWGVLIRQKGSNETVVGPPIEGVSLEGAIEIVDQRYKPEGWSSPDGYSWKRAGWLCSQTPESAWMIYRTDDSVPAPSSPSLILASKQKFLTADRARQWVEIRLDRTKLNLRGPRPRAGEKAKVSLPVVRATADERAEAIALAEKLGVNYSDMMRAALKLVQRELSPGGHLFALTDENGLTLKLSSP